MKILKNYHGNAMFYFFISAFFLVLYNNVFCQNNIISENQDGLTIEYIPSAVVIDTLFLNNSEVFYFSNEEAVYPLKEGDPSIPYHVVRFGIPAGSEVEVNIIDIDFDLLQDIELIPLFLLDSPEDSLRDSSISYIDQDNFYPQDWGYVTVTRRFVHNIFAEFLYQYSDIILQSTRFNY